MKSLFLVITLLSGLYSQTLYSNTYSEPSEAEKKFIISQPLATKIAEGVYAVETDYGSIKTYGFGLGGMKYDLENMQIALDVARKHNEPESYQGLLEAIYYLEGRIKDAEQNELKASQSGSLCSVIPYDLSATVLNESFWYLRARAEAGFQQFGAGPPFLFGVVLTTFAQTISTLSSGDTLIVTDSDTKTYAANGLQYLSADVATTRSGPSSQCMTGIAQATITFEYCGSAGFESLTETGSIRC